MTMMTISAFNSKFKVVENSLETIQQTISLNSSQSNELVIEALKGLAMAQRDVEREHLACSCVDHSSLIYCI